MARGDRALLLPGDEVSVRTRFDGTWAEGYRICGQDGSRYAVERCSDGFELPDDFHLDELRPG